MLTDGYNPDFDRDYAHGRQGEFLVDNVLAQVAAGQGAVEVKTQRFPGDRVFVELEQKPRRMAEYKPSGLATTQADYWAFVFPGDAFLLVPVARLRAEVSRRVGRQPLTDAGLRGDNPTRGLVVPTSTLLDSRPGPTPLFDQEAS